jgi:methionyl-tRNA formyltransferase
MNIVFFTQDDPLYVKVFFDRFLQRCTKRDEIKAIVISRLMGKKRKRDLARQMYDFYGPRDFLRMGARAGLIKLMSRRNLKPRAGNGKGRTYSIRQTAAAYGIPAIERSDLNSSDFRSLIREYEPDLFISVASPVIFKKELIELPGIDCINLHSAPLPNYRGMMPNFWQLYHGEKTVGITVHRIDTGIDTGDIVVQRECEVVPGESLNDLIIRTKAMGAEVVLEVIEMYRKGPVQVRSMPAGGSYFSFPTRQDVQAFKAKGGRIL